MNVGFGREVFSAYVVFTGGEHRRFWRIFTRKGWRHCFLIVPVYYPEPGLDADAYSMIINPVTNHVSASVVFKRPIDAVTELLEDGATCAVKFKVDRRRNRDYVPRGFLTCVSLVKAVIGIGAWYVWTPEHLARWLMRNGGKLITGRAENGEFVRKQAEA